MQTREFSANNYALKLALVTSLYLVTLADGREMKAMPGDYLILEGEEDTKVGILPGNIVDAMAVEVDELVTVERVEFVNDREVLTHFSIHVGPGERLVGVQVVDGDGYDTEKTFELVVIPSHNDMLSQDEKDANLHSKRIAHLHPANVMNSAAQRAAKEVLDLEEKKHAEDLARAESEGLGASDTSDNV